MHSIFKEKYVPGYKSLLNEKLINKIKHQLTTRLQIEFEPDWLLDVLWRWSEFVDLYNDPLTITKKTAAINELDMIKDSIKSIKKTIRDLERCKKIDFVYMDPLPPQIINIDETINSLHKHKIDLQIKIAYLIGIERANLKIKEQLKHAMLQVVGVGIGIGLKNNGKAHAGRKHINQLFEFISIITGIEDKEFISRHYKSHQELIDTPITYFTLEPISTS